MAAPSPADLALDEAADADIRDTARRFIAREITPHYSTWEQAGRVPRDLWRRMGAAGLLCPSLPEAYGGAEAGLRASIALIEEMANAFVALHGFYTHSEICAPYILHLGSEEQKRRWLPGCASGDVVLAIAMTEPGAGSDLKATRTIARRDSDGYRLTGQKTFITNGLQADLVIVLAEMADSARRAKSLFLVEADRPGFARGRVLDKVGQKAQDTTELFFDDVAIPPENLLGEAGRGLKYLMEFLPRERILVGVGSLAGAEAAFRETLAYVQTRQAFGQAIGSFQHLRFKLAEMKTELAVGRAFLDRCIQRFETSGLAPDEAAMCKYWLSDLEGRILDACVQMHGGYGYMREYPVARAFADARAQRIYAGTNEIMKEIIARGLEPPGDGNPLRPPAGDPSRRDRV
ncbi:acyl-CoA dehydrogenase family protein [Enterovirga rhinocerotis]|uniref:Acyl-CoA dehydrogenase/long-chain-acyl-CoA dehydrogenase n=1 Tax=Enterovirga rhinocerotis TaxID=1339210 RepID=A0A4R7BJG3_9HYPH|nr:acyl-CoA dehydrogenase family protein [Enterovirga rhinocerotis]TDR85520.1 acyl-CoA dehydrogenase/long-chain-acyl-CoA dehydrogenase [Enterovirga rhinocerotis]